MYRSHFEKIDTRKSRKVKEGETGIHAFLRDAKLYRVRESSGLEVEFQCRPDDLLHAILTILEIELSEYKGEKEHDA